LNLQRAECLRHLHKAGDLVRACEVALAPLWKSDALDARVAESVRHSLRFHISGLEALCMHPLLFFGQNTFSAVRETYETLSSLQGLSKGQLKRRLLDARGELAADLKTTLSLIFQEADWVRLGGDTRKQKSAS
jgi:hypothetical protein